MNSDNDEIKKRFDTILTCSSLGMVSFLWNLSEDVSIALLGINLLDTMPPLANIEQAYDGCQLCHPACVAHTLFAVLLLSVNGYAH